MLFFYSKRLRGQALELRFQQACSKLYCGPQSVGTVAPNTGQGLAILTPAVLFLIPGKRRESAFKAATTTTVPNRDAHYPTMPHPALHKHSIDTRCKIQNNQTVTSSTFISLSLLFLIPRIHQVILIDHRDAALAENYCKLPH